MALTALLELEFKADALDDAKAVMSRVLGETREFDERVLAGATLVGLSMFTTLFLGAVLALMLFPASFGIVISIRDIVMSSVYRSEHAPRYQDEPHIRVLGWTRKSI